MLDNWYYNAQTACIETFYANAQITAQGDNWHQIAQRNVNTAYRRFSTIFGAMGIEHELRDPAWKVCIILIGAIQYMDADLCFCAQDELNAAQAAISDFLEKCRERRARLDSHPYCPEAVK